LKDHLADDEYDAIIFAVAHDDFKKMTIKDAKKLLKANGIIYDVKYLFNADEVDGRL